MHQKNWVWLVHLFLNKIEKFLNELQFLPSKKETFANYLNSFQLKTREKESMNYSRRLREKYKEFPRVKEISKKRHLPKAIYNAAKEIATIKESQNRKQANRRAHSKPGAVPYVAERKKHVVNERK